MATTKKSSAKKASATRAKAAATKAAAKGVTLQVQLSAADQAKAIECLQKNGKIAITLNTAQLLKVPISKRIISRDCGWIID